MTASKKPSAFEKALSHTLGFEGGYANDPADRGGETFRGISRISWPKWPGWALIDRARADGLTSAPALDRHFADDPEMARLVTDFYRNEFWKPFSGDAA